MRHRSPAEWIAAGRAALAIVAVYLVTMGAFFLITGCATLEDRARTAAVTDSATTLGALALGAVEANPIGLLTIPAKIGTLLYARTLPEDEQAEVYAIAGPLWGGATANNICIIAVLLTGGIGAPACIAVGIGYGWYAWQESKPERDFIVACNEYRRIDPSVKRCVFRAPA